MQTRLEGLMTVAIFIAATAVAAASVHREFARSKQSDLAATSQLPVYTPDWKRIMSAGVLIGDSSAPVKIIEFADLECPFCRTFHSSYTQSRAKFGKDLALVFVHYPLPMHRFARPAARAAECAGAQGRFGEFQDAVFDKQDSLGLKTWASYAVSAGVSDTALFSRCASDTVRLPSVEGGLTLAAKLNLHGTPSVIINGWKFDRTPYDSLSDIVARLLAGKPPMAGVSSSQPVATRRLE